MSLPTGVVTFVFSDIEGSTRLWESDPEGMRRSLARHDQLVTDVVEASGGHVFKHTGDGFGAAFESVTSGLEAAAGVAFSLANESWEGPDITCRIGVHSGEAEPQNDDYYGATVTRTARLMDAGNGGQIIVSEAAHQLVGDRPPDGMAFIDVGEHRLKDLGEPIGLYRLVGSGASDDRQLRTLESAPHNLPVQLSSFVGREVQIKEVSDLVKSTRLVTLTGIGGVGKTRLSLQVAAEVLAEFEAGAWFVELAPLGEAGLIADTVAEVLHVPQDTSISTMERVTRFLSDRRALLLIDNCEHLIDDVAGFVDAVLRVCPDVHILTTSREGLAVMGEALWRVPSLRVDDDAAAVELFIERARLVRPDFAVDDENRSVVADLCVRLDGIPLAIELATARLKMLTVEQIADHLGDRFRLLTGGSRTAVERQRTLLAMMDWSYDLLSDQEQALLRRLAVFYDGFTYAAAESVCTGETLPAFEVLDLLGRLVEASMVIFESEIRPRYRLLETVRQYSLDKLVEAGEADEARLRHATYFQDVAGDLDIRLETSDFTAMEEGTEELGNARAAMTWAADAGHGEILLDLAVKMRTYFWNRVLYRESVRWLSTGLDMVEGDSELVGAGLAFALTDAGNCSDLETMERLLPRAEALHEATDDDQTRGSLANALASNLMRSDVRAADDMYRQAHDALRAAGHPRWWAPVQNRMLTSWFMNDRSAEAEIMGLADEAVAAGLSIHRDVMRTAFVLLSGDYEGVIEIAAGHDPIDEWEEAMMLLFRMNAERALGRFDAALRSADQAETILGPNSPGSTGWTRAIIHLEQGDIDAAIEAFETPFPLDDDADLFSRTIASAFWALVAERGGDHENATILWGYLAEQAERGGSAPADIDRSMMEASLETLRSALGQEHFDELQAQGRRTSWQDVPLVRDHS